MIYYWAMATYAPILKPNDDLVMSMKKTAKMRKNVLLVSAFFRPNFNSHALCQEVAKGVKAASNEAVFDLGRRI